MVTTGRAATASPKHPYGEDLAASFGADDEAPFLIARSLQRAQLAVTELKVARPAGGLSDALPRMAGYIVACHLQTASDLVRWEEGQGHSTFSVRAGESTIDDLRSDTRAVMDVPFHTLVWILPQAVLDALADEANAPHVEDLRHEPGALPDDTFMRLSQSLLPALRAPEQVNRIFADHVMLAFAAHAAQAYGGLDAPRLIKGGLAPWQERRSKEMLVDNIAGDISLAAIADACGLSVSHFARAFRKSTGQAPHAWLLQARVERAKGLLQQRDQPLSEIALACGFVDQSHFTRVFVQRVGLTPGAWRRIAAN